jgi:hypothetical protein
MAHKFLVTNVDDGDLDRNLLILFSGRRDLCTEFKRLYVDKQVNNVASTSKKDKILSMLLQYATEKKSVDEIVQSHGELPPCHGEWSERNKNVMLQ